MKSLRNMAVVFLVGLSSLGLANITKVPQKRGTLEESLIQLLEMPNLPTSYQKGMKLFLESWSNEILNLNILSLSVFERELSSNLVEFIASIQVQLKDEAVYFSEQVLLNAMAATGKSDLKDYEEESGWNSKRIKEVLIQWLRQYFINKGNEAFLSPEEYYLVWSFIFNSFNPNAYRGTGLNYIPSLDYSKTSGYSLISDQSFIFDSVEEYVHGVKTGEITQDFESYARTEELNDFELPFLRKFYGIERSIKPLK